MENLVGEERCMFEGVCVHCEIKAEHGESLPEKAPTEKGTQVVQLRNQSDTYNK